MFLNERWTVFRLKQLAAGKPYKVDSPQVFIDIFFTVSGHEHDLLSELYLFNFLLPNYVRWNPNPYVGDVQLGDFFSFIYDFLVYYEIQNFLEDQYKIVFITP